MEIKRKTGALVLVIFLLGFADLLLAQEQLSDNLPMIDTGDTAWMIVATALVMLMTVPGLAIFYGGLSKQKDVLNTIAMSFIAFAIVSVLWVICGYTFTFGDDLWGIIGYPAKLLLSGVGVSSVSDFAKTIPEFIFVTYQLTFAAITVALVSGALIERIKFSAWILFCIFWMIFVYVPIAHWVWGGGFLAKLGALDFAGGTVVHINAGVAALVGVLILGKRLEVSLLPHNLPMVAIGTGLLWFGWFGFNAGSALAASGLASAAFINTNTATAMSAISWMFSEWIFSKRPTILGIASGAVAGLVAITPAAGFVNIKGAIAIGMLAGIVPFFAVAYVKPKLGYDDALDVFGIHGVAGILGAILTGIFADPAINEAGKGLLYGNPSQLLIQIIAVVITITYVSIVTALIFLLIRTIVGLRVDPDDEISGLDQSCHGEKSYNLHIGRLILIPLIFGVLTRAEASELKTELLGTLNVNGTVSVYTLYPGDDKGIHYDAGSALFVVSKNAEPVGFTIKGGAYAFPVVGVGISGTTSSTDLFSPIPVAYLELAPAKGFSLQVGKLHTLLGYESPFTYNNNHIQRGLIWNMQPIFHNGVRLSYASDLLAINVGVNDGFYSLSASRPRPAFEGGLSVTPVEGFSLLFNFILPDKGSVPNKTSYPANKRLLNIIAVYTVGPVAGGVDLMYAEAPRNADAGVPEVAKAIGGCTHISYRLKSFAVSGRVEYVMDNEDGANDLVGLGDGNRGWTFTLTPAWTSEQLFIKGEFSYVRAEKPFTQNNKNVQPRLGVEVGFVF